MCSCKPANNRVTALDVFLSMLTGGLWTLYMAYRPRHKK